MAAVEERLEGRVLLLGLLGVGGYNTLAYIALQYTGATNASLLNSFIPVATIALSWAFLDKRLRGIEWLGVLTSLAGVTAIVSRGELATLLALTPNVGDLWMLGAVFVWALYTIGLQWRPTGVHPMLLLAAFTLVGLLALAPAYAWEMAQGAAGGAVGRVDAGHRLHRHAAELRRLRLLQPRGRRSRRQQGQPVHPPDAGLRHRAGRRCFLGEIPAPLPRRRHRPDLPRHLP